MGQEIDGVSGTQDGGHVAEEVRGLCNVARRRGARDRFTGRAPDVVLLSGDPPFVVAVADGATGGERPVVVQVGIGVSIPQGGAERFGCFEDDERIDRPAWAGANGGGEGGTGRGVVPEPCKGSSPRAEQGGSDGFVLPSSEFGIGCLGDADDGFPVFDEFEVGASRDLMREVVPGSGGERIVLDQSATLLCQFERSGEAFGTELELCERV
jgi:hypothetical protein